MMKFYIPHSENLYYVYFKMQVAKTYEKVFRLNMTSSRTFPFIVEKSYNKPVIDFNFGRHKALDALKSDIHLSLTTLVSITFWVDKLSCLPHWSQ